jgi:hypothetical protein
MITSQAAAFLIQSRGNHSAEDRNLRTPLGSINGRMKAEPIKSGVFFKRPHLGSSIIEASKSHVTGICNVIVVGHHTLQANNYSSMEKEHLSSL